MIPSEGETQIEWYTLIDTTEPEKRTRVFPAVGETFVGIPHAWHTDNSMPYIEVRVNGQCVRTINALAVLEIAFVV